MERVAAEAFVRRWVSAWNDRDLEGVLAHYSDDVVVYSPRIRAVTGVEEASVRGKPALRAYWSAAMEASRELFFEPEMIYLGADSLTLTYTNHRSQSVCETFVFGGDGRVRLAVVAYA